MIIGYDLLIGAGLALAVVGGSWGVLLRQERLSRTHGGMVAMFESRSALLKHQLSRLMAGLLIILGMGVAAAFAWLRRDLYVDGSWLLPRAVVVALPAVASAQWRIARRPRPAASS